MLVASLKNGTNGMLFCSQRFVWVYLLTKCPSLAVGDGYLARYDHRMTNTSAIITTRSHDFVDWDIGVR